MKGILVTSNNQIEVKDFDEPLHKSLGAAVGGYIEIVHPMGLAEPGIMIVNDEGLIHNLPVNALGCLLYGTHIHGSPILGNIVIMKTGWTANGMDIIGLNDQEAQELYQTLLPHVEAFRDAEIS